MRLLLLAAVFVTLAPPLPASVVTVARSPEGKFTLLRDGHPFFINGAGGQTHLDELVACGGNAIRTWGIDALDQKVDGKPLLDRAHELGLAVTVGIWLQHERHGFSYADERAVTAQREAVRLAVRKYKDHPALLLWGLGNEMEGPTSDGSNAKVWEELNTLAAIVKQEDPSHPVMTAIAGAAESKVKAVVAHYPNLDILGINAYAGASGTGPALKRLGWTKAFILTEFGTPGHWEVGKTAWGAPIEPSSWEKAASYYSTQKGLVEAAPDTCLGSFAFVWGHKQEVTSSWYGMFLETGEKLPSVDGISRAWTGQWPANRSPKIASFKFPLTDGKIPAGHEATATVEAVDAENDPLHYEWAVFAESTDVKVGGDQEKAPPMIAGCIAGQPTTTATVKAPAKPGAYRLFVTVRDGKGGASRDNIPFLVTP